MISKLAFFCLAHNFNFRKNLVAARKSLAFYQGDNLQNELIINEYQHESDLENVEASSAKIADLFVVSYLRRAMLLTFMALTLCLPFYPILQSSTTFLKMIGIDENLAQYSSTLIGFLMVIGCLIAPVLLNNFKRRSLVLLFGWLSTVSILIFSVCGALVERFEGMKYAALLGMLGYIISWR
jgi:hypothetical protein